MNTLLLISSALIFSLMIFVINFKYGIQKSISDSYYKFKRTGKILFTFAIWGFTLPLIVVADSFLFMLAGSLLCLVGAAVNFKFNNMELRAHLIGASGGIALAFIALSIDFNLWFLLVAFMVWSWILYLLRNVLSYIWWIEILAYYLILIGLMIVKL